MIRTATAHDAPAIAEIHVQTWQHAYRGILPAEFLSKLSVAKRTSMWDESIANGHAHVSVAEIDGQVVGFSALGLRRDGDGVLQSDELLALYLSPLHWSKGIGRQLWLTSRLHSMEHGASSVSLWVLAKNQRAIAFYTSAGFEAVANSSKTLDVGGAQVEEIRYTQQLGG
ncbi:GNAT family N-acetyltransferase [Rhodoferax saidenbachensis]|uniref:GNAT family N-acetyltransferase n=1 Tax=Rhodoferax saidenbachensis TaxID=1484693 RepID=UPI00286C08C9|nr:GNAT family N-acetyltransferase [Rhodoferax saidenbachensis]